MAYFPNIEKVFDDLSETIYNNLVWPDNQEVREHLGAQKINVHLDVANTIGAWSVSDFKKANHQYQFSFDEINVLTINALHFHNQSLFTYLYRQGYGLNSVDSSYSPRLKHIQKKYNFDMFKETENLRIFIEAGGKLFRRLEDKKDHPRGGQTETMIFDFLTLSGDRDTLPALEDLDKNLLAHVYSNECFDSNGDPIPDNLKIFCRSLLPALFTTRKHLPSEFNSAHIHPEELTKMLEKGPLPLGTSFAFLRSFYLEDNFEYTNNGNIEFSSLEYSQKIVSILCQSHDLGCTKVLENTHDAVAHSFVDEYNRKNSKSEQFTHQTERNVLEIMSAYFELRPEESHPIQVKPLGEVLSVFKKDIGIYKDIDSMCSSALSNMLVSRILEHEPTSDWEEHPALSEDCTHLLSNFKTKIACKCWTPQIMRLFEKNINLPFYSSFLDKVIDENCHWKKNYDRIALLKKSKPIIDELFADLVNGNSVDEKAEKKSIPYTLAYRQWIMMNHMRKMPIALLKSAYSNTSEKFREHLFIQMLHKELIQQSLSPLKPLAPKPLQVSRF